MQVSQYGNMVWMSVFVVCGFSLADVIANPGLAACSWVGYAARLEWLALGHRPNIYLVRSRSELGSRVRDI